MSIAGRKRADLRLGVEMVGVMPVKHDMRGVGVVTRGGIAAGQMPRAASNGGTVPRGGANKSLTTDTPVGELRS